jgi:hypothetical protein
VRNESLYAKRLEDSEISDDVTQAPLTPTGRGGVTSQSGARKRLTALIHFGMNRPLGVTKDEGSLSSNEQRPMRVC